MSNYLQVYKNKNNVDCKNNKETQAGEQDIYACPCLEIIKCTDCCILDNGAYCSQYDTIKEVSL